MFFLFLGKISPEKSLTLEFSFRYSMVKQKICPEIFFILVFDPCISQGRFFGPIFRPQQVHLYTGNRRNEY